MRNPQVLVVEDEVVVAMDLKERLSRMGYRVPDAVPSGEEAIEKAAEMSFDLVLMDIRLSGDMDGIQAADEIRARFDIPVVYLTAFADDETLRRARATAPFGYLTKPFQEQELQATIEMALHRHALQAAARESKRKLSLYAERLEILLEVERAILSAQSPEAIAQAALRRIRRLVPCQRASVTLFDYERQEATVLAAYLDGHVSPAEDGCLSQAAFESKQVLARGQHHLVEDMLAFAERSVLDERLLAEGVRSCVSLPLVAHDQLIGSLNLGASEPGVFGDEQVEISRQVADSLAVAVHQACLHGQVSHYCSELETRNADLEAFAHMVAHDLRAPLSLIVGFATVLSTDAASVTREELDRYLDPILENGRKMERIIRELLLLAEVRKEEIVVEPLDLRGTVTGALQQLALMIEESQAEIILPEVWPVALGYAPWVEEVWVNYISNALKYGGDPPRVELGAKVQKDGQVCLWVRDNGSGMSLQDQSRLFAPFTSLGRTRSTGYGLGLSIVRHIVEKLDGQVGVESKGGQGCVFSFTLPGIVVADTATTDDKEG